MSAPDILVVGSANMDLVVFADRLPAPGETLLGGAFQSFSGGKGANQAVAAARAGGKVAFLGRIGMDIFGARLRQGLQDNGVDTRFFIRGGFAEINPTHVTVLAEEAIPMTELDLAVLDQRIKDAQDDEIAAETDEARQKAAQLVNDLQLVRAAF